MIKMKKYIKGIFRRSIFKSDKGYVIGIFRVIDTNDSELEDYINKTITFTGYFHELKEEDNYLFFGELIDHNKYGKQYQVSEYEHIKPEDKDGIIEFLSSDLFPGIGIKVATNIVNTLGKDTLDQILENPSVLDLVPKLSQKAKEKIIQNLSDYESSHKIIVSLTEIGFSMKEATLIYSKYKGNSLLKIEENIYDLIEDIDEIHFSKVDSLRENLNILDDSDIRVKACIIHAMKDLCFKQGDTYLHYDEIKKSVCLYCRLEIEDEVFCEYMTSLVYQKKIVIENEKYYLISMYVAERYVADRFVCLATKERKEISNFNRHIEMLEKEKNISYNLQQKEAIKKALNNNLVIITGGPGTGKTTIINAIVNLYQKIYKLDTDTLINELALLAPTGRASKRMSESTLLPAYTIHRFLKWNKEDNSFMINEQNKDESRLIIIDEVSMIDLELMQHLLRGLNDDIKLVIVGDYNQLPCVGSGNILKDMIESDIIDVVSLDMLYRQSEDSYIPVLAQEVKDNELGDFLMKKEDFLFLECSKEKMVESIKRMSEQVLEKGYDYKRVQLMAPMYGGLNGIDNLNRELQSVFNPKEDDKKEIHYGDVIFREQDKILQLVNMPDENVFNGDIGIIEKIVFSSQSDSKKNEIYVNYDGNIVKYTPKDFIKIKHGYIISIHKSQGSEFELVIIPLCMSYYRMLYRKLIYTAITRAKKKLILVGEPKAFIYSVENENNMVRKTSLKEKMLYFLYNNGIPM